MALQPGKYIILSAWNINVNAGVPQDLPANDTANVISGGLNKVWTVAREDQNYYFTLNDSGPVPMVCTRGGAVSYPVVGPQGQPHAWRIEPRENATFSIRCQTDADSFWYMGDEGQGAIIGLFPLVEPGTADRNRQLWKFSRIPE